MSFWLLDCKVLCIVADKAADIKAVTDLIIPKVAHFLFFLTIELIIKQGLETVSDMQGMFCKTVGFFQSFCSVQYTNVCANKS